MTSHAPSDAVDMLLDAMFCQRSPVRRQHSFIYNQPGRHPLIGGAGFEINYDNRKLLHAALFIRRKGAAHLHSLPVSSVEKVLMDFVYNHFWIIGNEAFDGCLLGSGATADAPFADFISTKARTDLVRAIGASELFVEPRHLYAFPLVVLKVEQEFECPAFFLAKPDGLTVDRLPPGYVAADLLSTSFPPFKRWDGTRKTPSSWLGVRAGTREIAKRNRGAVLGALALLPHRMERYQFSMRTIFGGISTFDGSLTMSTSDPHTPALAEDVTLVEADIDWLITLSRKIISPTKSDRREMRALEYFYQAWVPDSARRFPTLFGALDAIYGDAGRATQSVIEAVGPVMDDGYDYQRLKMLLGIQASVIHGGAPNVYESSDYHRYYVRYEVDAIRDLELIVASCLRQVIFGSTMRERSHTYAALIKKHTGADI